MGKYSHPNAYKTDGASSYVDSPLKEYGGGRTVHCHNDACPVYNKTLFRGVLIKRFVEHETHYWTCTRCGSQHISEHDI
jgi:hypothetical protein